MNDRIIARLEQLGVTLFRINLSHTKIKDLPNVIEFIQKRTQVPLCLDSEGAQVRTGDLISKEIHVRENSTVKVHKKHVPGDEHNFNLYPQEAVDLLEVGDFVSIDFNAVLVQVVEKDDNTATLRVLNGGKIGQNKAVTIERDVTLPALTEKDKEAFKIGREMGIKHVALSFANHASDIEEIRAIAGEDVFLISKIECKNGLLNLDEIADKSDALLIDRGDLSRQEPIERIPWLQKAIIKRSKELNRKVYVATNLLESMITSSDPTRAEVNDVTNTLIDGADGLVLAAETAVGHDPIGCASMIVKLIQQFELGESDVIVGQSYYPSDVQSLLIEPHGGRLVHREETVDEETLSKLNHLEVSTTDLMDCEQIAFGTYSPLTGFMNLDAVKSVLDTNRLPDGLAWTMPIILQTTKEQLKDVQVGERIGLTDSEGVVYAMMDVSEVSAFDPKPYLKKWFQTDSPEHPGVANLLSGGDQIVAGDITLVKRIVSTQRQYQLTPAQSRFIFSHKGWSRVVGFHTRNVIHRAHEFIQLKALETTHADGLYVSPVIGPMKKGDFMPDPIIKSYQMMLDFGFYPEGKVVLGCFATYPRFAGPREAAFTMICRKNMGCSHFIIGRNHSGVGDYYQDKDYPEFFDSLGDVGITPVFFEMVGYNAERGCYDSASDSDTLEHISGTQMREALTKKEMLPDWFMREKIQNMLHTELSDKQPIIYQ